MVSILIHQAIGMNGVAMHDFTKDACNPLDACMQPTGWTLNIFVVADSIGFQRPYES